MPNNSHNNIICIFGLGLSGISTARYLQKTKQDFFVVDTRENPPGKDLVREMSCCQSYYFGFIPTAKLNNASMIILSPGVSPKITEIKTAKDNGVKVIGDVELFVTQTTKKIIAITGSNGKSTVTDLTYQLLLAAGLKAKIGGNFGIPVLDFLPEDDAEIYVLELSSFQLDTLSSLKADVAVVLNITEDHMDRYENFAEYIQSKLSIFHGAKKLIANADEPLTFAGIKNEVVLFSLNNSSAKYHLQSEQANKALSCDGSSIINVSQLTLSGKHNWSNVLASLAILNELGVAISLPVLNCLKNYQGLEHRFQLVLRKDNVDWINDSKATNVGATQAALESVDMDYYTKVFLIAGGDAKASDLSPLKKSLTEKISTMILIGKDAKKLAELLPSDKIVFSTDMRNAVKQAYLLIKQEINNLNLEHRQNNYLVLLSPACASLDMYKNYEFRGQAFIEAVKECT